MPEDCLLINQVFNPLMKLRVILLRAVRDIIAMLQVARLNSPARCRGE